MNMFQIVSPLLMGGAANGAGAQGGNSYMLISLGLIFVIMYFMIIRPQNKKQKEARNMLNALKKDDKVATIGGIRGVVAEVKEDSVIVKVDKEVKMEFSKSAIASVINPQPKGEAPAEKPSLFGRKKKNDSAS